MAASTCRQQGSVLLQQHRRQQAFLLCGKPWYGLAHERVPARRALKCSPHVHANGVQKAGVRVHACMVGR